MDVWNLDIPLRGERDYVQSSDLFASLESSAKRELSPLAYVRKLILRRMSHHAVEAHFVRPRSALGTFELRDREYVTAGWLAETPGTIACRKLYDETPVIRAAAVHAGRAQLSSPVPGYTAFDQIIILSKIIGAQIAAGTWVFSRVDLDEPLREDLSIDLALSQVVLSRCQIIEISQASRIVGRAQGVLQPFKEDRQ